MPIAPLYAGYLLVASLLLEVLAFALYLRNRDSLELRFGAVVTFLLVAVSLAFAPLVLVELSPRAKAVLRAKAHAYAEGQDPHQP